MIYADKGIFGKKIGTHKRTKPIKEKVDGSHKNHQFPWKADCHVNRSTTKTDRRASLTDQWRIPWLTKDPQLMERHADGSYVALLGLHACSYMETSCISCTKALSHAIEKTLSKVIFESDVISVIQAISQDLCGSETGHLIQGIQLVKSSFLSFSFRHVKRD